MNYSSDRRVPQSGERILFITGRLAEHVVRRVVGEVSAALGFQADVHVVGISVAALMHVNWLLRKLDDAIESYDRIYLPGWCQGDLNLLEQRFGKPFSLGPKEIHDLGEFFGRQRGTPPNLDSYDIEIIAEINHAPAMPIADMIASAEKYCSAGADVIDLGCIPGEQWSAVGEAVTALRDEGLRVSIDSFDRTEVEAAVSSGAELILSCNSTNAEWLSQLGTEAVVIPDEANDLSTMWQTAAVLEEHGCPYRFDPILEPVGFGFARSLSRYYQSRAQSPQEKMMMGIGNVTEMSEVDSAGVNFLLAAICQELGIQSVLTTEVIPWCQTAVKEFDIARRLVKHAVDNQTLAKRVCSDLVMLRDPRVTPLGEETLQLLSESLRDPNYRIFVEQGEIHIMNRDGYWRGADPFELFESFSQENPGLDASHAFYLGFELSKAVTALTLGKQFRQDQALNWGFLTVPEQSSRKPRHSPRMQEGTADE